MCSGVWDQETLVLREDVLKLRKNCSVDKELHTLIHAR